MQPDYLPIFHPTLIDMVRSHGRWRSREVAILIGARSMVWAEVDAVSDGIANGLIAGGLEKGDRIAVLLPTCLEYFLIFLGIIKAGGVAATLSIHNQTTVQISLIKDSGAKGIFIGIDDNILASGIKSECPSLAPGLCISLRKNGSGWIDYDGFVANASPTATYQSITPEDNCTLSYSSGTTGTPKGIIHSHYGQSMISLGLAGVMGLSPSSVGLLAIPTYTNGNWIVTQPTLYAGSRMIVLERYTVHDFLAAIEKYSVTYTFVVPAQVSDILAVPDIAKYDLSSLRFVGCGGSILRKEQKIAMQNLVGPIFHENYSNTEGVGTWLWPDDITEHAASVGRVMLGSAMSIIDDNGNEVGPREIGEVVGWSPYACRGYWNRPEENAKLRWTDKFGRKFIRSGDVGWVDEDGYLHLADRKKDMLIVGGNNVYAADIEAVLAAHPSVQDCAVFPISHERLGELPAAAVILAKNVQDSLDDIMAWANDRLGKYQKLKSIFIVEEMPRNDLGKVVKKKLKEMFS